MKRVLIYAIGLVLCMLLLGVMPVAGEEKIYDNVIRLHVLANSDSEQDQANKLAVRDAILAAYSEELAGNTTAEAVARVEILLPQIEELAEKTLADAGDPRDVTITFSEETYPERVYGELHFPAGRYLSLRVLIGEGAGQNWWCVLFPPLCVGTATEEVAVTTPEEPPAGLGEHAWRLVSQSGEYQIRFRVLEWLMNR
ncbi:MAG: stage II sporulation protein R [Clostridia bacterium]|nr:stage II sporulation protein R [Clostridia bacterium]